MKKLLTLAALAGCFLIGCDSSHEDATETNLTGLPCNADSDCPASGSCVFTRHPVTSVQNAPFCNVSGGGSATGTLLPAIRCTTNADCGAESLCLFFASDGPTAASGFCSIPASCPRSCMTAADEVRNSCETQSDCDAESFCTQLPCTF